MNIIYTCPECGLDLMDLVLTANPPILQKRCPNCGWVWTDKPTETIRVPFDDGLNDWNNYIYEEHYVTNFQHPPCIDCDNNPKNGGSGICNCTLNTPKITC
jgi:Zn-finger nucleic acid-binding protein